MSVTGLFGLGFWLTIAAFVGMAVLFTKACVARGALAKTRWMALTLLAFGTVQSLSAWARSIGHTSDLVDRVRNLQGFSDSRVLDWLLRTVELTTAVALLSWAAGLLFGLAVVHAAQVWRLDATIKHLKKLKASA